jgi:hypothetical protein
MIVIDDTITETLIMMDDTDLVDDIINGKL